MLARGVADRMRLDGQSAPFQGISPVLKKHDIAFCNLECQISPRGQPTEKLFHFKAHPDSATGLFESGFNVFSLANNHISDYGLVAMMDTRKFLEKNGFNAAGVGPNRWEALRPTTIEKNGLRIAIFCFTSFWPPGFNCKLPRCPQPAKPDSQATDFLIRSARENFDVVIVSFHWGKELQHFPSEVQKKLAHVSVDAGADLVIGHHPHAIQTIEKYKEKFIFYSLGNCVFDQEFEMGKEGLLLSCALTERGVISPKVMPILITHCRPVPATGKDFSRIEKKLRKYCVGSGVSWTSRSGELYME